MSDVATELTQIEELIRMNINIVCKELYAYDLTGYLTSDTMVRRLIDRATPHLHHNAQRVVILMIRTAAVKAIAFADRNLITPPPKA